VTTPPLWVLTDERGAGKTVHCGALAEQASIAGWDVAGLLSPGIFKDGVKTGILTQDLRTGESHPLAMLSRLNVKRSTFNLELGQWLFDPTVVDWGNQILQSRLPCDLFIIDELGPLEFFCGRQESFSLTVQNRTETIRFAFVVANSQQQPPIGEGSSPPPGGDAVLRGIAFVFIQVSLEI